MTPEALGQMFEEFLGGSRHAVVLEDGATLFDLAEARYSVSGEQNKCLLHVWSAERNIVRRIVDAEVQAGRLRLLVQKLGQARPSRLDVCRDRDRRPPSARRAARSLYQSRLRRALERRFPDWAVGKLSNAVNLEQSFGPIYARGVLKHRQNAFAVLGVNCEESQSSIDAALTFGILWLDACRRQQDARVLVEGLKLFVPAGTSAMTRERMAHLHPDAAKWELYEFDERNDEVTAMDCGDRGNLATRLVRCPDEATTLERFAESVHRMLELLPECEVAVISPAEVAFRWHGLEFARAQVRHEEGSLRSGQEVVFGIGAEEHVLEESNQQRLQQLCAKLRNARQAHGSRSQPLWRLHPERWSNRWRFAI